MDKLELLKLWAMGLGIPVSVFDTERFKMAFEDDDPVDSLRAIERTIGDNFKPEWREANKNIRNSNLYWGFLQLMRQ